MMNGFGKGNMKIGTWNVKRIVKFGLRHRRLQETWLEIGIQKLDNFALFNSGLERKKHEFGCGFYVSGEFLRYVKDFKIISERICCLRLKAKWFSYTLINVHAPTNEKKQRR